uniref:Uncharacterized protein n=1 Tax=Panagrolaimus sp. PS1159 TaxID=55785 RepID=A0AC35FGX3_9BILA
MKLANINPSENLSDKLFLEDENINELMKIMDDSGLPFPDDADKCRALYDFYAKERESFIDPNDRFHRISQFLGIEKLASDEPVHNNSGRDGNVEDNNVYPNGEKPPAEIPSPQSSLRNQNSIEDDVELDKTIRPNRETTLKVGENDEAPDAEGDQIPGTIDPLVFDPRSCTGFKPVILHGSTYHPGVPMKAYDRFLPSESQLNKTFDQKKKERPVPLPRRTRPKSFEIESIISTDLKIDGSSENLSLSPPNEFQPGAHSSPIPDIEANPAAVIPPVQPPATRRQRFTGAAAEEKIRLRQAESKD